MDRYEQCNDRDNRSWFQKTLRNLYGLHHLKTQVPHKFCCIYAEKIPGYIQVFTQVSEEETVTDA